MYAKPWLQIFLTSLIVNPVFSCKIGSKAGSMTSKILLTETIILSSTSNNGKYLYLENLPRPVSEMYFVVTDENAQKINILIEISLKNEIFLLWGDRYG